VSLSSNPDADFRYSTIYTQIGIYKGRIFAIKKVRKKSVDITREMKKELKMVSFMLCVRGFVLLEYSSFSLPCNFRRFQFHFFKYPTLIVLRFKTFV